MKSQGDDGLGLVLKQVRRWETAGSRRRPAVDLAIRELHIELTHRCDMRCVMCHHWRLPKRRESSGAEIARALDGARLVDGIQTAVVTGGEPWLHPDSVEIVGYLARRFPQASLGILSNLGRSVLLRDRLAELASQGVNRLWLGSSLDGIGEIHDRMRGRPGAFAALRRSLDWLRGHRPEIPVSLNFTLTPANCGELWAAYVFSREAGCDFGAQFVVRHAGFPGLRRRKWSQEELLKTGEQIDRIMRDLAREGQALPRLLGRPEDSLGLWCRLAYWDRLRRICAGVPIPRLDCLAGRRFAMLDPEGNIFFCPVQKHRRVGNIRQAPFDKLWQGAPAVKLRRALAGCQCRCWLGCIAYPFLGRVLRAGIAAKEALSRHVQVQ
jgi:MoaA/NifB/PqqE/SkfB family radical SAM enzyme